MTMKRLNVTPVIEEDLLREALEVAARRLAALERIQPLLDRPAVHLGGPRPSRDELRQR